MVNSEVRNNNQVRGFMIFDVLMEPIQSFLANGDGFYTRPVFDRRVHDVDAVVDMTLNNFVKFVSTAYGAMYLSEGFLIVDAMKAQKVKKKPLRFRSSHPLYTDGSPDYQNACLLSGLIYMGIPVLPYFDGNNVLVSA